MKQLYTDVEKKAFQEVLHDLTSGRAVDEPSAARFCELGWLRQPDPGYCKYEITSLGWDHRG